MSVSLPSSTWLWNFTEGSLRALDDTAALIPDTCHINPSRSIFAQCKYYQYLFYFCLVTCHALCSARPQTRHLTPRWKAGAIIQQNISTLSNAKRFPNFVSVYQIFWHENAAHWAALPPSITITVPPRPHQRRLVTDVFNEIVYYAQKCSFM